MKKLLIHLYQSLSPKVGKHEPIGDLPYSMSHDISDLTHFTFVKANSQSLHSESDDKALRMERARKLVLKSGAPSREQIVGLAKVLIERGF